MVAHCIVTLVAIVIAVCAQCTTIDAFVSGSPAPLVPTLDDVKCCNETANGRIFKITYKMPLQTCKPFCVFENGDREQVKAKDGQMCCDTVGVGATGLCKNGTCLMVGVADMSTKKVIDIVKKYGK